MATLKVISMRLKSVKNIQKITQSMKMVSAAKYTRAERDLRAAKPIGAGASAFYSKAEVSTPENVESPKELLIAVTSDRGLCGAVHTSVARMIRTELQTKGIDLVIFCFMNCCYLRVIRKGVCVPSEVSQALAIYFTLTSLPQ